MNACINAWMSTGYIGGGPFSNRCRCRKHTKHTSTHYALNVCTIIYARTAPTTVAFSGCIQYDTRNTTTTPLSNLYNLLDLSQWHNCSRSTRSMPCNFCMHLYSNRPFIKLVNQLEYQFFSYIVFFFTFKLSRSMRFFHSKSERYSIAICTMHNCTFCSGVDGAHSTLLHFIGLHFIFNFARLW